MGHHYHGIVCSLEEVDEPKGVVGSFVQSTSAASNAAAGTKNETLGRRGSQSWQLPPSDKDAKTYVHLNVHLGPLFVSWAATKSLLITGNHMHSILEYLSLDQVKQSHPLAHSSSFSRVECKDTSTRLDSDPS